MSFEVVVNKNLPVWNGMSKKNADGDSVPLEKSDKSYVVGYYLGMDHITGKESKEIAIHKLQFESCGDSAHLSEEIKEGDEIMVWGAKALDDKLVKNVPIGARVRILWLGKVKSKANPTMKYHDFEVAIDKTKSISAPAASSSKPAAVKDTTSNAVATEPADLLDDDDDSLPF